MIRTAILTSGAILLFATLGCGHQRTAFEKLLAPSGFADFADAGDHPVVDTTTSASRIRVMSYNVRTNFILDGPNMWPFRKEAFVEKVRQFAPDLLGTQESTAVTAAYIREQLQHYAFVGAGRNDGAASGEMCAIFYRADRFDKMDEGHFWLSETPAEPGSKSWGGSYPRITSWVKLRPRGGDPFYFFNTHFPFRSKKARVEGAKLLHATIARITRGQPVIVTGDFNTDADTLPYRVLTRTRLHQREIHLVDSLRAVKPHPEENEGTRHNFHGWKKGKRIDWVLASPEFRPVSANIDQTKTHGRHPSDHYPVTAVYRLRAGYVAAAPNTTGG